MPDAHANFAYSTVAVGPSPALSGTTLTLATGEGALFPAVPFNATVWPANAAPRAATSEIVRVTGRTGDVLTFTRSQEGTPARAIGVGDQVAATITKKTLTDVEQAAREAYRDRKLTEALALWGETFSMQECAQNIDLATGRMFLTPYYVLDDDPPIAALHFRNNISGTSLTLVKAGVLNADGSAILASSLDDKANWGSTGRKPVAMQVAWPPSEQLVQLGILAIGGGTMPRVDSGYATGKGGNAKAAGATTGPCGSAAGKADFVTTAITFDGNSAPLWIGLA